MLRPSLKSLPASRIREVANAALGRTDVVKFWFGEGDLPTPGFIREAAKASLDAGETFYGQNLGLPELRDAIAGYSTDLRRRRIGTDRIAVTSSGVSALSLIGQALLEPGDRAAIVTPVWPNLTSIPRLLSAEVTRVPLQCRDGAWSLDLDHLLEAARGATMVLVNSPNNPTGWTMPQPDWDALLAHCRRTGTWLVADDAYERLYYGNDAGIAPGVLAQVDPDERFISANTVSKTWTMTGWRLGWIVAPRGFIADFAKIVEFNTSCAPTFVQRAALAAIAAGPEPIAATLGRLRRARDRLVDRLHRIEGVEVAAPPGAMYAFLRLGARSADSLTCAKALVTEAGLGLAPGIAFGPEGEGWLRWCFAASEDLLDEGVDRLAEWLGGRRVG
jgi:aspartate/methionine/tyrosine aminotransferase